MESASKRKRVSYDILHNLSTVDLLYDEQKKKKMSAVKTVGIYAAERLIASREDTKEGTKYLVKWKDYSSFENTWEPEAHLSPLLLRYFNSPTPEMETVQENIDRMRNNMLCCLRHKYPEQRLTLEFRHDVYKYLFHGKGKKAQERKWDLFEEGDFSRCELPHKWNYMVDMHGDGVKIRFPVKIKTVLTLSPKCFERRGEKIVEKTRTYTEKICIRFIKVSTTC